MFMPAGWVDSMLSSWQSMLEGRSALPSSLGRGAGLTYRTISIKVSFRFLVKSLLREGGDDLLADPGRFV